MSKPKLNLSLIEEDITHKIIKDFFHENLEEFEKLEIEIKQDKMIDDYFTELKKQTKARMWMFYYELKGENK